MSYNNDDRGGVKRCGPLEKIRALPSVPPFVPSLCLWLALPCYERRILALERLGHTAAPALSQGLCHGIGEDILLPSLQSVQDAFRDGLRRALRYFEAPGHIGVHRAGQDGMNAHPPPRQESPQ